MELDGLKAGAFSLDVEELEERTTPITIGFVSAPPDGTFVGVDRNC